MTIYTMGFTQKLAKEFFEKIRYNKIDLVIDIRLNNRSQLAGFTKGPDLEFFLKEITGCTYAHELLFAPTKELLDGYKKGSVTWEEYTENYNELMASRNATEHFRKNYMNADRVLLLCSEPKPDHCHRRLLAEMLAESIGAEIVHI